MAMNIDIGEILSQIIGNYNFAFMLSVNILTYFIIKALGHIGILSSKWGKRIILGIVTVVLALVYSFTGDIPTATLLNSAIAAPVFYSWIMKPVLEKLGLGYIKFDG